MDSGKELTTLAIPNKQKKKKDDEEKYTCQVKVTFREKGKGHQGKESPREGERHSSSKPSPKN